MTKWLSTQVSIKQSNTKNGFIEQQNIPYGNNSSSTKISSCCESSFVGLFSTQPGTISGLKIDMYIPESQKIKHSIETNCGN